MNEDPVVINYANADTPGKDSSVLYRWAIGLALFPLFGGIAIYILFLLTSANIWAEAGLYWLGFGILLVTASAIVALVHAAKDWSAQIRSKRRILARLLTVLG